MRSAEDFAADIVSHLLGDDCVDFEEEESNIAKDIAARDRAAKLECLRDLVIIHRSGTPLDVAVLELREKLEADEPAKEET